jgi:uncharacterized protein (TIGR02996 family)
MSDEAAFLNAIIASPDEDMPRLVYADWLDEHDSPIQADFIRTQCRLAACSPANLEYPDLLEHHAEAIARFQRIAKLTLPELPPGFVVSGSDNFSGEDGSFRRGFLHMVTGFWAAEQRNPEEGEIEQICAGLPQLLATTTARQLWLPEVSSDQFARILATPGAEELRGLGVIPDAMSGDGKVLQTIAAGKAGPNLQCLTFLGDVSSANFAALAKLSLNRLTHLDYPMMVRPGPVRDLRPVLMAKWFQGLRTVRTAGSARPVEAAMLTALAKLPHLETLDLRFHHDTSLKAFASPRGFRALGRLVYYMSPLSPAAAGYLAKARFPRLAELELLSIRSSRLLTLLTAPWFSQLRLLTFELGNLNDKAVLALAKAPVAANLRIVRFKNFTLSKTLLATVGDGSLYPNLTTLEMQPVFNQALKPEDAVKFVKNLSLARIRHLNFGGWPLGDGGAIALASNPVLANLTRLLLGGCNIGEKGFTALARSPHLQQLIELDLTNNKLTAATAIRDKQLLPRLAALKVGGNSLSPTAQRKLHEARGLIVE